MEIIVEDYYYPGFEIAKTDAKYNSAQSLYSGSFSLFFR